MLKWSDPLSFIHGLTAQQRRALKSLEVNTVGELISIFPRRYDDYSRLTTLSRVPVGVPVTVKVVIKEIKQLPTFRRRFAIIKAVVFDQSGSIAVTWFNQPWLLKQLKIGDEIYLSGAVTRRPRFGLGFTSPLWEPANAETLAAGNVAPVYPLTGSLAQKTVRKVMKAALADVEFPVEWLPDEIRSQAGVLDLSTAYRYIHKPNTLEQAEEGRRRFAFGELFIYQLALRLARKEANTAGAPEFVFNESFAKNFVATLPFELTPDQKKAIWAAVKDMEQGMPMRRLLQGDVGCGKTVVGAMLSALSFRNHSSAALMAPTDLLAKQHTETFRRYLSPHHIPVLLVTSSVRIMFENGNEQKMSALECRERLSQGRLVVVGTHALLERGSSPPDLALAIVDEQHRFGVSQREALTVSSRLDGKVPHLLSMSATPIPRSLALTLLGDLDVSIIKAKPAGRLPIKTSVYIGDQGREVAYSIIRQEVSNKHQAFIVCPLIDPSDVLGVKSVETEKRRLQNGPLKDLRIGMVHGRMSPKEKDEEMSKYLNGELDVLVATTVVEVGVDVPQATVMVIEGAERFGLAQLHQLRGRVGRSAYQSFCLLIATDDSPSIVRLRVMERTIDGFEIAEEDLRLRGEGNLLGLQQSGQSIFQNARITDLELMARAREISDQIITADPDLNQYKTLKNEIVKMRETSHRE